MPGGKHMKGVSAKRNRQYEHIKKSEVARGMPIKQAKEIAAKTVNMHRAMAGETRSSKHNMARYSHLSSGHKPAGSVPGKLTPSDEMKKAKKTISVGPEY